MRVSLPSGPPALARLAAQVRADLERIHHPPRTWVVPRTSAQGEAVFDVVIVGAGQGGLTVAHALRRECVDNILVIDRAPRGATGCWRQYARMPMLRTHKALPGPDLRLPSLTYRSWHEAVHGTASWDGIERIARDDWQAYLDWYRDLLELPVRHDCGLTALQPRADGVLTLQLAGPGAAGPVLARKVVLATGLDGTGAWTMPDFVTRLPARWRATTAEPIDFAALAGKTVAVLGQGASAADNAACALEAGAARVVMCVRRAALQTVQPFGWTLFAGFLKHLADMPDAWRWRFMNHILTMREGFPQDTYQRMRRHANFEIWRGAGWTDARLDGGRVLIETARGALRADYLICGTGMDVDLGCRPELAACAPHVATWADRYTPPEDQANARLARFPYHAPDGSFTEKVPGAAPWLKDIHDYTYGTTLSFGPSGSSINAMYYAVPRLVAGITRGLFAADLAHHWQGLLDYQVPAFTPVAEDLAPLD